MDQPNLFEWRRPGDLLDDINAWSDRLGVAAMRREGHLFREAFVPAHYAVAEAVDWVRLIETGEQQTPDFAILRNGVEQWIEVTEADRPGRRRTDEYKVPQDDVAPIPDDEWTEPETYNAVVLERVTNKVAKNYAKCDGLIIHSNAFPIARSHELTADWWRTATEPARERFGFVTLLYSGRFLPIWINGVGCADQELDVHLDDDIAIFF